CDNNRRNGISIISANGLKLISPYAANSNGTLPMAGLDIEPNSPKNELKGIYISGLKTENNSGNGLDIVLNNLYGGGDKNVDIQIKNPKDVASVTGARVISFRQKAGIPGSIRGMIHIDKPLWSGQKKSSIDTSAMREKAVRLNMQ
ncbi:MAG: hypothetical protein JKY70_08725, partial [Mucilaginibacter sp.]|nr:hypothetical protein [Mucilaginibacter sp.]